MTLQADKVQRIEELSSTTTLSLRAIAERVGCSPTTAMLIVQGRHAPGRTERLRQQQLFEEHIPAGEPQACPGCGQIVPLPCVACRARAARRERHRRLGPRGIREIIEELAQISPVLGLDLKPADRARYEEVRRRRDEPRRSPGAETIEAQPESSGHPAAGPSEDDGVTR